MFYICINKNKQLLKIIIMKTLILSIAICITAISCGKSETKKPETRYKFYHADTNKEFMTISGMSAAMQKNKVYRLDLKTGECVQYVTNNK